MEQERVTYLIIVVSLLVVLLAIAMVVLFAIYTRIKNRLLRENKELTTLIKDKLEDMLAE